MNDINGNEVVNQSVGTAAGGAIENTAIETAANDAANTANAATDAAGNTAVGGAGESGTAVDMADRIMADFIKETTNPDEGGANDGAAQPVPQNQQGQGTQLPAPEVGQDAQTERNAQNERTAMPQGFGTLQAEQTAAAPAQVGGAANAVGAGNSGGTGLQGQQTAASQEQGLQNVAAQGALSTQAAQGQAKQNVAQGTQAQQNQQAQPMPRAVSEAEWKELVEAHPEVVGTKLPDDIFRACLMSKHSPLHVYDSMMLKQTQNQLNYLLSENARLKQDLDNFRRAPVMPMAGGAPDTKPKDEILEAFMKYQ